MDDYPSDCQPSVEYWSGFEVSVEGKLKMALKLCIAIADDKVKDKVEIAWRALFGISLLLVLVEAMRWFLGYGLMSGILIMVCMILFLLFKIWSGFQKAEFNHFERTLDNLLSDMVDEFENLDTHTKCQVMRDTKIWLNRGERVMTVSDFLSRLFPQQSAYQRFRSIALEESWRLGV